MKRFLLVLCATVASSVMFCLSANAQQNISQQTIAPHRCTSEFAGGEEDLNAWARDFYANPNKNNNSATTNALPTLTLPVALYLIGNTDGTNRFPVNKALQIMCEVNDDYRPHDIRFSIDTIDQTISNTTYNDPPVGSMAHTTTMLTGHKMVNRANLYMHGGGTSTGLCGTYSGTAFLNGSIGTPDVVNMFSPCLSIGQHQTTHELAHYLAIPHTYNGLEGGASVPCTTPPSRATGGVLYNATDCTTTGDRFCDTSPDYNPTAWVCGAASPLLPQNSGNHWSCPILSRDSVLMQVDGINYMSAANDACRNQFTSNQRDRMRTFITVRRAALLTVAQVGDSITQAVNVLTPNATIFANLAAVKLEWNAVRNAREYVVTLYNNSVGAQIVSEHIVRGDTAFIPTSGLLTCGRSYFYTVKPINKRHFCSPPSAIRRFTATCVATERQTAISNMQVQPNPLTQERFSVQLYAEKELDVAITMSDLTGKTVRSFPSQRVSQGDNTLEYEVGNLPNGTYMVQMQAEGSVKTSKLVIMR